MEPSTSQASNSKDVFEPKEKKYEKSREQETSEEDLCESFRKNEVEDNKLMRRCSKIMLNLENFINSSSLESSSKSGTEENSTPHTINSILYEKLDQEPPLFPSTSTPKNNAQVPSPENVKKGKQKHKRDSISHEAKQRIRKKLQFSEEHVPPKRFCNKLCGNEESEFFQLNFKDPCLQASSSSRNEYNPFRFFAGAAAFADTQLPTNSNVFFMDYEDADSEEEEAICTCVTNNDTDDEDEEYVDESKPFNEFDMFNFDMEIQYESGDDSNGSWRRNKADVPKAKPSKKRPPPRSKMNESPQPEKPVEIRNWLGRFHSWSESDRLKAIDSLIPHCEADQVRHMMHAIEPLFQRDFISLLPRELALTVLGYLGPTDLLRAAQTCRFWRFLADDKLLWKIKCKNIGIVPLHRQPSTMPKTSNSWKAAYLRQRTIERNWRTKDNLANAKLLKGHDEHVITCLQFYGNKILSGSDDTTLKLWSANTGKCLRTLMGHTGGVWSCQMVGRIVVSGSTDRTLRIWDISSGFCLRILSGHTSTVRCMDLHNNRVVSGSRDTTLRIWSVPEGRCLHILVGHLSAVRCVQYNGRVVVSGAYDCLVKVWSPDTGECIYTLASHSNRVYSLQFDGSHIVSGSLDTAIKVWDVETGTLKHTLKGHQSLTSGMELRSNILVSGNADSTVKVWDIISGKCLHTLSGPNKHQSAITCLQSNSSFVITSSDDGTVKLWDIKTGEFIRNLLSLGSGGSGGVVWRIRASTTKLICAVGSRNGTEETKLLILDFDIAGACLKCDE